MIKNYISKIRSYKDKIVNGIVNAAHYFAVLSVGCYIALWIEYGYNNEIIIMFVSALILAISTKAKLIEDKQTENIE